MPSFLSNDLIRETRARKKLTQEMILHSNMLAEKNLSRIENHHQRPRKDSFINLMSSMDVSVDTFFCPYLENQTLHLIQLRDELLYYLSYAPESDLAIQNVENLIKSLEQTGDFNQGINRQFILYCKATLGEIQGQPLEEIISFVTEGIAITYPEYNEATF